MNSTIIVVPRERFSSIIQSLESLFATIGDDVPVIVVEGGSPGRVRADLKALQAKRPFEVISRPYMITPNEARNIGARRARSDFVVFCDNDLEYQPNWLDRLQANAIANAADMVSPLIFLGPSNPPRVHHAGGFLVYDRDKDEVVIDEVHRLGNAWYDDVRDQLDELAPVANEVSEFHCMLMHRGFFERLGGLDERLISREHMDLALRAKALGATVTFEKDSHVTYMAKQPFRRQDILYHLFRWSDELALQSFTAFEETWGVRLDVPMLMNEWIRPHRRRALPSLHPTLTLMLGSRGVMSLLARPYEVWARRKTRDLRPAIQRYVPSPVAKPGFVHRLAART